MYGCSRRVIGMLLGPSNGESINVASSFRVPCEEFEDQPQVMVHDSAEAMSKMFRVREVNSTYRARSSPVCSNSLAAVSSSMQRQSAATHDQVVP